MTRLRELLSGGASIRRAPAPLMLIAGVIAAAAIAPMFHLTVRAFGSGPEVALSALMRPRTLMMLGNTMLLVAVVSAIAFVIGVATAWAVSRMRLPFQPVWLVLACLPLAVPSFVAAFSWLAMFPATNGFWPLVAVMTATTAPYVTVPTMGAFAMADHSVADVARTLGRGRLRVFFTISLPQVMPAALAGTLIVALYVISDFGAPATLRYDTLTTGVYGQLTAGADRAVPAAISLMLAAVAVLLVLLEHRARGRAPRRRATARRVERFDPGPAGRILVSLVLAAIAAASVAVPVGALVVRWFSSERFASTLPELAQAALTTLLLGLAAATATAIVAVPTSYLAARWRGPIVSALESAAYVGQALPGVVVALALVSLILAVFPFAYQTPLALVAAYVLLFLPKSLGAARAAFEQVPRSSEEASRTLGRGPIATWLRVTLPGALPGMVTGWLLVATSVMKELPATLLLRPIGVDTLATQLWGITSLGAFGAAAPIGLLLIALGLVPTLILTRSLRSR